MRMSISAPSASKCSKAARTAFSSATSNACALTMCPASASALAALASFFSSRPLRTIRAPAAARPRAIASPRPSEDPVMRAVLPLRSKSFDESILLPLDPGSNREVDPHRRMVGGLVAPAHGLVDGDRSKPVGGLGRQDEVVDTDAVVLLPGARLVVPESVEAGSVGGRAQ